MGTRHVVVAVGLGVMMGGAFLTYAGPDTNADGLLDFSTFEYFKYKRRNLVFD